MLETGASMDYDANSCDGVFTVKYSSTRCFIYFNFMYNSGIWADLMHQGILYQSTFGFLSTLDIGKIIKIGFACRVKILNRIE